MTKSKVALCIDASQIGGIETHVLLLYKGLRSYGYHCRIFFLNHIKESPIIEICKKRRVEYSQVNGLFDLFAQMTAFSPKRIHSHGYKANIICRLFAPVFFKRTIATYHAGETKRGKVKLYDWIDRLTSFLSMNIAVNDAIAQTLPFNVKIIPNFIELPNTARPYKPPQNRYKLYFIGRLSEEKDPLLFCQLGYHLPANYELHVIGIGPLIDICKKDYDQITFHGLIKDMRECWPSIDMVCITSKFEGLPLVLLESLSQGIPVVSFDIGAIKTVIPEMTTSKRDITQLAQLIQQWFFKTNKEQNNYLSTKYNLIRNSFSIESVVPQIIEFYGVNQ